MKCPHCLEHFHFVPQTSPGFADKEWKWAFVYSICPACQKAVIQLEKSDPKTGHRLELSLVHPKAPARALLPPEVPRPFAEDYQEACLIFTNSAKASAALSRRCLQRLLREKAGIKPQDLSREIQEVFPKLPTYLAEAIDSIRVIGNFAAHPLKSTNTGEILDVEPGEAEWQLDVLEQRFDFFFVQPERLKVKRDALNKKLKEAGKLPMK